MSLGDEEKKKLQEAFTFQQVEEEPPVVSKDAEDLQSRIDSESDPQKRQILIQEKKILELTENQERMRLKEERNAARKMFVSSLPQNSPYSSLADYLAPLPKDVNEKIAKELSRITGELLKEHNVATAKSAAPSIGASKTGTISSQGNFYQRMALINKNKGRMPKAS